MARLQAGEERVPGDGCGFLSRVHVVETSQLLWRTPSNVRRAARCACYDRGGVCGGQEETQPLAEL
jgi:hypothetical protein